MTSPEQFADSPGAPAVRTGATAAIRHAGQQWRLLLLAYAGSIFLGIGYAWLVQRGGDWNVGLPWERVVMMRVHDVQLAVPLEWVLLVVPWLGTNLTLFPAAVLVAGWLAWRSRWDLALWLMTAELGCLSMNWLIKHLTARERPDLWERVGWFGWGSYPSGHAMVAVAMLGTVAVMLERERRIRWQYAVVTLLVLLIVYSRLHHGVHWPTDMVGGVLVGGAWLAATAYAFGRRRTQE